MTASPNPHPGYMHSIPADKCYHCGQELWYVCICGYETPVATGMMIHLTASPHNSSKTWNKKHGYKAAEFRIPVKSEWK